MCIKHVCTKLRAANICRAVCKRVDSQQSCPQKRLYAAKLCSKNCMQHQLCAASLCAAMCTRVGFQQTAGSKTYDPHNPCGAERARSKNCMQQNCLQQCAHELTRPTLEYTNHFTQRKLLLCSDAPCLPLSPRDPPAGQREAS